MDGTTNKLKGDTYIINTQFGLTDRFEFGTDLDLSDNTDTRMLFNGKYVAIQSNDGKQRLAVGIFNAGKDFVSSPYIVGTKDFNFVRGHLGIIGIGGKSQWFAGTDYQINDKLSVMADYTNGDENFSSVGLSYQCAEHFGLLAGAQFPNVDGNTRFTLHFVISGSFEK